MPGLKELRENLSLAETAGRGQYLRLFLTSFAALYVEIMLIRWVGTEFRLFAYFQNLTLIACFLGFGYGCFRATKRPVQLFDYVALCAIAILIEIPWRGWAGILELMGAGPNGWTAAEGALKVREASYVATEGLSSEQFLHGPSVALDAQDTLVALDGGGPAAARTEAIAAAMEVTGTRVVRIAERDLGEPLSIFPLTVWVQRIAVELAEARGVSPDRFRYEEDPAREQAIESLGF